MVCYPSFLKNIFYFSSGLQHIIFLRLFAHNEWDPLDNIIA